MTDVVQYAPTATDSRALELVKWAEAASAAHELALTLVKTQMCPEAFRNKAGEATAVLLAGAALGLDPIASLRSHYVVKGQIGMYTRSMVGLAQRRGHRIWTEVETDSRVVVCGHRAGDAEHVERVEWTIERARQAGLIRRGSSNAPSQYETQPRAMLWARAAGDVCRRIAADALQGIPEFDEPEPASTSSESAPAPATRTVQRQRVVETAGPVPSPVAPELPPVAPVVDEPGRPPATASVDSPPTEPLVEQPAGPPGERVLSEAQRARIMAELNGRGIRGHDARVAWLERFLSRTVATTNELTADEASRVIDRLEYERAHGDDAKR